MKSKLYIKKHILILLFILYSSSILVSAKTQFKHRAWQLHIPEIKWIKARINDAVKLKINAIQLSHNIIMNAKDLDSKKRLDLVKAASDYAKSKKIDCYAWIHEFHNISGELKSKKKGKVNFDNKDLWIILKKRYKKMFSRVPSLTGIVLTFHETDNTVYKESDIESSMEPAKRTAVLIEKMHNICKENKKKLIVRTFAHQPKEVTFIGNALKIAASRIGPHDIIVMSKHIPHDFQLHYPHNPRIGDCAGFDQIAESDCGSEFFGQSLIPLDQTDYLKYRLDYDKKKNVMGAVTRIERSSGKRSRLPAWGTLSEISVYTFSRMIYEDLNVNTDDLRMEWIDAKFGKNKGSNHILSAYKRTLDIVKKTLFINKEWFVNHSMIPGYKYANKHIEKNSIGKWTGSLADKKRTEGLLSGNKDMIGIVIKEKDEAIALCDKALKDINNAKKYIRSKDYEELKFQFSRLKDIVTAFKHYCNLLMLYYHFKNTNKGKDDVKAAINIVNGHAGYMKEKYNDKNYDLGKKGNISKELKSFTEDIKDMLNPSGKKKKK